MPNYYIQGRKQAVADWIAGFDADPDADQVEERLLPDQSRIRDQAGAFTRGYLDGVTWAPNVLGNIYDNIQTRAGESRGDEPYSIHLMVKDTTPDHYVKTVYAGNAAGAVTGAAATSAAVPLLWGGMAVDAADGLERTVRNYLDHTDE